MLSSMLAGCLGGNLENDFIYPDDVLYASTNATIVEVWEDGAVVETIPFFRLISTSPTHRRLFYPTR